MIDKQKILKLNKSLKKGDQKAIAELSGISALTVNRFFNGNEDSVSDESAALIIESATKIIKQRSKMIKASEKLIDSIK